MRKKEGRNKWGKEEIKTRHCTGKNEKNEIYHIFPVATYMCAQTQEADLEEYTPS